MIQEDDRTRGVHPAERFQLCDESGRPAGGAERSACHADPRLIHLVVHLHVFDGAGRLYLQKRAAWKDACPGMWDTSVGGHVTEGEAVAEALLREAREELAIDAAGARFLFSYLHRGRMETEYAHVSALTWTGSIRPDPSEIDEGRFFGREEIEARMGRRFLTPMFEKEWAMLLPYWPVTRPGAPSCSSCAGS